MDGFNIVMVIAIILFAKFRSAIGDGIYKNKKGTKEEEYKKHDQAI